MQKRPVCAIRRFERVKHLSQDMYITARIVNSSSSDEDPISMSPKNYSITNFDKKF